MSTWMGQARAKMPRLAEEAVERARLTVVPRRVRTLSHTPFVVLVSLVMLAGVVGLLLFNTSMQQASFKADELEARAARLHAEEQSLRMQVDRLRDPQRVGERARRLGMVPLTNPAFIRLSDGSVLGNAVPASPLDAQRLTPRGVPKPASLRVAPITVVAEPTADDLADASDPGVDGVPSDEMPTPADTTEGQD